MNTSDWDAHVVEEPPDIGETTASQDNRPGKTVKAPSLNARRRIEEYLEEKYLQNITRGVFDD